MRSWTRLLAVPALLISVSIAADKPPVAGQASAALVCIPPSNCIGQECYCDCRAAGGGPLQCKIECCPLP